MSFANEPILELRRAPVRESLLDHLSSADVAVLADVLGRVRDAMRCGPPPSARRRRRA